jgi:NTE family protein
MPGVAARNDRSQSPPNMTGRLLEGLFLGAVGALLVATTAVAAAADGARPRVGLVLGGGGARGAAHIGVLEVLEKLRVPVDCVAGTSMGALVTGAWASGVTPAQMQTEMSKANWSDMFQDNPEFSELSNRNKRMSQRFLPGTETGVTPHGLQFPPGIVYGEKIKLFFNTLVRANLGEREIQDLRLPIALVATDIGNGRKVVFRDGSLTMAMRASMSVPGLLAPAEYRGLKLVDGGLVDNVPIDEVRRLCNADVVIAVNVGSPLLKPDEVGSLLTVSAQMVNILTEQNVAQSLATLKPTDIYIRPDLDGITAADFGKHREAAARGRAAAEAVADRLRALSVSEQQFAQWWAGIQTAERAPPRVDEIEIAGLKRVNPEAVRRHIEQKEGEPIDTARLDGDLLRVFGDGWYESTDYTLLSTRERNILRITPVEKSWGPDYLRLGLRLEVDYNGATFDLRAAYQKTWLNSLGGELLLSGQIGSTVAAAIDFYQPLDPAQRFFVEPAAGISRSIFPLYQDNLKYAEYDVRSQEGGIALGLNFGLLGPARIGWDWRSASARLDTGLPFFPSGSESWGGWFVSFDFDQLNRLYFPTAGWAANSRYFYSTNQNFSRLDVSGQAVTSFGRNVVGAAAAYTGSPQGQLPYFDAARYGGFLRMSAFSPNQLVGDNVYYGQAKFEHIIGVLPIGLHGDIRLGLALEAVKRGVAFSETNLGGWLNSTSVYLGGETPFGPVYVGYGYSTSGVWNVYLFVGTP